jgi:hypothetical protein
MCEAAQTARWPDGQTSKYKRASQDYNNVEFGVR